MSSGKTHYDCECGGVITEQWDSYGSETMCDSCDNHTKGNTSYPCKCGATVKEEWEGGLRTGCLRTIECECDNPEMTDERKRLIKEEKQRILNLFLQELDTAISKYGADYIDIIRDDRDMFYGTYHSKSDSFPVTKTYDLGLTEEEVVILCYTRDVGYYGE